MEGNDELCGACEATGSTLDAIEKVYMHGNSNLM